MKISLKSQRLHLGFFGSRNVGKSCLFNFILGQDFSIVSDLPGTTTDPVRKAMEIRGIGPCLFIDTAGLDDEGEIGELRVSQTYKIINEIDLAIMIFGLNKGISKPEEEFINELRDRKIPCLFLLNSLSSPDKTECGNRKEYLESRLKAEIHVIYEFDERTKKDLFRIIARSLPQEFNERSLFDGYDVAGKTVIAVMPQDKQAPKGRLILPQMFSIRELLDKGANVFCCVTKQFRSVLNSLNEPPYLILSDATALKEIKDFLPSNSPVTSFSALFAAYLGDVEEYRKGAESIFSLKDSAKILISELCTHEPLEGDIGRVKIPNMLMEKLGIKLKVDICSGTDFPKTLSEYSLIIQCGACMSNRRTVMSRIRQAVLEEIPITNYGILIERLQEIK